MPFFISPHPTARRSPRAHSPEPAIGRLALFALASLTSSSGAPKALTRGSSSEDSGYEFDITRDADGTLRAAGHGPGLRAPDLLMHTLILRPDGRSTGSPSRVRST